MRKRTLLPILLLSSTAAYASPTPPDAEVPEKLIDLRAQLFEAGKAGALKNASKFRPLCDEAGYPLVGNVIRKGGKLFQPSEFCKEVRKGDA